MILNTAMQWLISNTDHKRHPVRTSYGDLLWIKSIPLIVFCWKHDHAITALQWDYKVVCICLIHRCQSLPSTHWCRRPIPWHAAWLAGYTLWCAPREHVKALSIHTNAQLSHQFSLGWLLRLYSLPHIKVFDRDCQLLPQEPYILVWLAVDTNLDWWYNLLVVNGMTLLNCTIPIMPSKAMNWISSFHIS